MIRRTTIELDDELLARAKRALGESTTRATVEEALRRLADELEGVLTHRAASQKRYLERFASRADASLLASEEMWR